MINKTDIIKIYRHFAKQWQKTHSFQMYMEHLPKSKTLKEDSTNFEKFTAFKACSLPKRELKLAIYNTNPTRKINYLGIMQNLLNNWGRKEVTKEI